MSVSRAFLVALLAGCFALPQSATASLSPQTTVPIVFTKTLSADKAKAGDTVYAKTIQAVKLADGQIIPSGTEVVGHVVAAAGFVYDKAPYTNQKESILAVHFDSVRVAGRDIALNVAVRAMADPAASWESREVKSSDLDPVSTVTQVGGDQLVPSQDSVVNRNGDTVAYNRRDGVYAHLIANGACDGSSAEVSVGIYSAVACGLYGFTNVSARDFGSISSPSTLWLVSTHTSPKIWRNSTALLEALPVNGGLR